MEQDHSSADAIDPVYLTSRTAKQIHDLSQVEKDIARLIRVAGTSVSLLTLPQTDGPDDKLPQGEERSEQFVIEVSEYFERLENIQTSIRSALAHIRSSQIAPSAIDAPPAGFIPSTLGVGLPSTQGDHAAKNRGLQQEKVERNAWNGILDALTRLKEARDAERQQAKPFAPNSDSI